MKRLQSVILSVLICFAMLSGCGDRGASTATPPDITGAAFGDVTVTYDGQPHAATVEGLPESVTVEYENNEHTDAGIYQASARLYFKGELLDTRQATVTIGKRPATVKIADGAATVGESPNISYTQEGVIDGDDLGLTLTVKTLKGGIKQVQTEYVNGNYDVKFVGGKYAVSGPLYDSSEVTANEATFLPEWAPFVLRDKTLFSSTVITSFSFRYGGLASGKTVSDSDLTIPLYIVPKNTSDTATANRSDYTEENGKKIILDLGGKLGGVQAGEWVTISDLHIEIGADQTLAIGDTDMTVLPQYTRNASTGGRYSFYSKIFGGGGQLHEQTLVFRIYGYSTLAPEPDGKTYISFLGDSISTYAGYSNGTDYNPTIGGNEIWFPNTYYAGADMPVESTWWHRTLTALDYALCVNNSWSGSVVNTPQTYNVRAKNLHNADGRDPDVIVIFMGVNDFAANTDVGDYDGTTPAPATPTDFSTAYGRTVQTIMQTYPEAEVYCCTFLPDRKRFTRGTNAKRISETEYNDAIRTIAKNLGAELIDLYLDSGITENNILRNTVDSLHPNSNGMKLISDLVVKTIRGETSTASLVLAA